MTLGIRYLRGYAVATDPALRKAEWPPHPARVFMAMAAAYFDSAGDAEERVALEWLESQEFPPAISASGCEERSVVDTYVPANDKAMLPRTRQPRAFPTVRPHNDSVFLTWRAEAPREVRGGLERLCNKVTRIGHSSSLVQMWVMENGEAPKANLLPDDVGGESRMRVPEKGTLRYLERIYNREAIDRYSKLRDGFDAAKGREKARLKKEMEGLYPGGAPVSARPTLSKWQGYSVARQSSTDMTPDRGPFDPKLLVFSKYEGSVLGLEATLQVTSALRNAAMKAAGDNVPEWLSGHQADGTPTRKAHIAFLALPFVDHQHSDGHVMGVAMAIPREISSDPELRRIIGALIFGQNGQERQIRLWRQPWECWFERETRPNPPTTLRGQTWTRRSRLWASVTPVVLHHYPKKNRDEDVIRVLREAFQSAGLPEPLKLTVKPVSHFQGAGHARAMPDYSEGGPGLCRYQTHVVAEFANEVEGPILVGRGRFRGYGLFRPVKEESHEPGTD